MKQTRVYTKEFLIDHVNAADDAMLQDAAFLVNARFQNVVLEPNVRKSICAVYARVQI